MDATPARSVNARAGHRLILGIASALLLATRLAGANAVEAPWTAGEIVAAVHRINEMEIEAGRLARRLAGTEAVMAYGQTLERDHEVLDAEWKTYAAENAINLDAAPPSTVGSRLARSINELQNLTSLGGAAFDGEFAEMMVADDRQALEIIRQARRGVRDPSLRRMLTELECDLLDHLRTAAGLTGVNPRSPRPSRTPVPSSLDEHLALLTTANGLPAEYGPFGPEGAFLTTESFLRGGRDWNPRRPT